MEDPCWQLLTDIGPEKILHIHNQAMGLRAIVVVDNTAAGPAIGGVRMAADVTLDECARLARAMTLKNAAAGLPHGGGKSVIIGDSHADTATRQRYIRAFARAIRDLHDYIPGPDMGTNESCMAWIKDEGGQAVGLPASIGGIPLDEIGATGYGLVESIAAAETHSGVAIDGATIAIQGFGSVGQHAARFLSEKGARIIAVADSAGTLVQANGFDVGQLTEHKIKTGHLRDFNELQLAAPDAILDIACDIWIPAARPDVINRGNVERVKARLIAEGANIPITADAEKILTQRGTVVLPDFVANAGGVICASVEYHGGSRQQAYATIRDTLRQNTKQMFVTAKRHQVPAREAAMMIATERVQEAMSFRRWHAVP